MPTFAAPATIISAMAGTQRDDARLGGTSSALTRDSTPSSSFRSVASPGGRAALFGVSSSSVTKFG